jgi:hypothetical protein
MKTVWIRREAMGAFLERRKPNSWTEASVARRRC